MVYIRLSVFYFDLKMDELKFLPAEWHKQQVVQLTWPHAGSDWDYLLGDVERCFVKIAESVALSQHLLVVCQDVDNVRKKLSPTLLHNVSFYKIDSNDTWARDHGGITVVENGKLVINDFCFNGWGMKFAANLDNLITRRLYAEGAFPGCEYRNKTSFVLEGGSIESDGCGTILTTEECLLSNNRNEHLSKQEIEDHVKHFFGARRVLWLKNGYLAGDDTDSHVDTLARFCSEDTIAYVKCSDTADEHYESLHKMETELQGFRTINGNPYRLIPLPMAKPVFDPDDGHRLPATYANFLIINGAVLLPVYGTELDYEAIVAIKKAFPNREIIPINCSVLILQHGSLHCVTMQYPEM